MRLNDEIADILKAHGPSFSSRLVKILVEKGISKETARKRISRLRSPIHKLKYLSLPKRETFYYLSEQEGTKPFYEAIISGLRDKNSSYYLPIAAIKSRNGCIYKEHFNIICGSSFVNTKGHIPCEKLLNDLIKSELLIEDEFSGNAVLRFKLYSIEDHELQGKIIAEQILIMSVVDLVRKIGLASANQISFRETGKELPKSGPLNWDIAGPSYLLPITHRKNTKLLPGSFSCDICIKDNIDVNDIAYFLNKCNIYCSILRHKRILPMFIGGGFTKEAIKTARGKGCIITTIDTLFGDGIRKSLISLVDIFKRLDFNDDTFANKIDAVFNSIGRIEAAASHLRGHLFEYLVSHIVTLKHNIPAKVGRIVSHKDYKRKVEIDVFYIISQDVVCCECKAFLSKNFVSKEMLEDWFSEKFPVISSWHKDSYKRDGFELVIQFWSVTGFEKDALDLLKRKKLSFRNIKVEWYGKNEILDLAKQYAEPMLRIIKEQYINNPLSASI